MRLLLDTHAVLWWFLGDPALSMTAREAIEDAAEVWVSAVSAMEVTTKFRIGKLPRAGTLAHDFEEMVSGEGFTPLAVTLRHAKAAGLLPIPHKDPFDRLLIAQAQLEAMTFVSNEAIFDAFDSRHRRRHRFRRACDPAAASAAQRTVAGIGEADPAGRIARGHVGNADFDGCGLVITTRPRSLSPDPVRSRGLPPVSACSR